jgi:DNA-binding MarR family transcriptional regulator
MAFDPGRRAHDLPADLALALFRVSQAITLMVRNAAGVQGLSPAQANALIFLKRGRPGARNVTGVAQRLGTTLATASEVVDALVAKGLVEKFRSAADNRVVRLALTSAGSEQVAQLEEMLEPLREILSGLGPDEQRRLQELLARVIDGLVARGIIRPYLICWQCRFFRPFAHPDDPGGPHHCAFMDAPLPAEDTYFECPDAEPKEGGA